MANECTVTHLVQSLRDASSDTEKFACLLLVPKALKADDCSAADRRAVFDAIGFEFLTRLLRTSDVPLGCPSYIYKSVALSVFGAFATDEDLCKKPEMLTNVPTLLDILNIKLEGESDLPLKIDVYQVLDSIASHEDGLKALVNCAALQKLSLTLLFGEFQFRAIPLLLKLLRHEQSQRNFRAADILSVVTSKLASQFYHEMGENKFVMCSHLRQMIPILKNYDVSDEKWKSETYGALHDILSSRVKEDWRNEALGLYCAIIEAYGLPWNEEQNNAGNNSSLMVVAVNLACIELRMRLEDRDFDQVVGAGNIVVTSYSILEHAIKELVSESTNGKDEFKLQMYTVIKSAAVAIIDFLSRVWKELGENWCNVGNGKLAILLASVRALAAWLAEETEACRQEVYAILPFLISIAQSPEVFKSAMDSQTLMEQQQDDDSSMMQVDSDPQTVSSKSTGDHQSSPLRFLLPSFCHFSSETVSLNIMFEHEVPKLLYQEMQRQWHRMNDQNNGTEERSDSEMALITIGGIFMNIIVLKKEECQINRVFVDLRDFCLKSYIEMCKEELREGSDNGLLLQGHLCVMGLMLLKNHSEKTKMDTHPSFLPFINLSIKFLEGAHMCEEVEISNRLTVSPQYRRHWDSLMDLWFLGMQCLQTLVVQVPWVGVRVWETFWLQNILSNVTPGCLEGNQRCAFDSMLATLAKHTASVEPKLNNNHIKLLCDVHGLLELKKAITGKPQSPSQEPSHPI